MSDDKAKTLDEAKLLNAAIFGKIAAGDVQAAADAISNFTRDRMYRLRHIPMRYYLSEAESVHLNALYDEINKRGYIALDTDGKPCVLSGKEPVLPHEESP